MSSGWRTATLADISTVIGRGIAPKYAENGDVVVINQRCVRDNRLNVDLARRHDQGMRAVPAAKLLRVGDILVNSTGVGTLGRTAPVTVLAEQTTADSHLTIIRPGMGTDPGWLRYAMAAAEPEIESLAEGSTGQTELSRHRLALLEFTVPPLTEQRAIAATLSALDDKIESNRRAAALSLDLLDALSSQQAAVQPRVPLGSISRLVKSVAKPATYGERIVSHYSLPAFDAGACPERVAASSVMSNKVALEGPAILVSRLNPRFNRTWWVAPGSTEIAFASPEFAMLQTSDRRALAGVWLAVRDEAFRDEMTRRVTGTSGSHQRVRPDDMLAIDVPDSTLMSAEVLGAALAVLDHIDSLRNETNALSGVRDALLPAVLSGRIRVPTEATP